MVCFIFPFKCVEGKCIKTSLAKDIKKNLVSALVEVIPSVRRMGPGGQRSVFYTGGSSWDDPFRFFT